MPNYTVLCMLCQVLFEKNFKIARILRFFHYLPLYFFPFKRNYISKYYAKEQSHENQ